MPGGEGMKIAFIISDDSEYEGRKLCLVTSTIFTLDSELFSITSEIRPELKNSKTVDGIDEFSHEIRGRRSIKITAVLADVEKCTAHIEIKRIHSKKEHSVDIQMTGEIKKELYHTFLNYLNQNLCVKEEFS